MVNFVEIIGVSEQTQGLKQKVDLKMVKENVLEKLVMNFVPV